MSRRLGMLFAMGALVAAPAHAWITTYPGGPDDTSEATSVAVDSNGDVIAGGVQPTVAKLDGASGAKLWQKTFDGSDPAEAYGFGVAVSGGTTPIVAGGRQPSGGGWGSLYASLDPSTGDPSVLDTPPGQHQHWFTGVVAEVPAGPVAFGTSGPAYVTRRGSWERELVVYQLDGYSGGGKIWDAGVDASGDVIVVGQTVNLVPGARGVVADRWHLLVAKLSGDDGSTIWQHVEDETSGGYRLALDADGNVLVAGGITATTGGRSIDDMLVLKLANADGAEAWRAQVDGGVSSPNDVALDVAVDAGGDAIVAGRLTLSQSDPLFQGGLAEFAVLKLASTDGSEVWRYTAPNTTLAPDMLPGLSGTKGEGRAITFDGGDPVVAGVTNASWWESGVTGHVADFTVVKLADADGSQQWLYVPGAGQARAIASASDGVVVVGHLNREAGDSHVYDMAIVKVGEGVAGTRVALADSPDPTRRKLKLVSKTKVTSPYTDRYGDPTYDGGRIVLVDAASATEQAIDLPASGWHATRTGFEFASLGDGCRSVKIDNRRGVSATCQGAGVHLPTGRATRGTLAVRIELGPPRAARYCMDFGGAVTRDDGINFKAKQAPAPSRCPG